MIGVLDATSPVGRLVVDELVRAGAGPVRAASHDGAALTALVSALPRGADCEPWVTNPANRVRITGLLSGLDVVLVCTPDADVIDAAVAAGVPCAGVEADRTAVASLLDRHGTAAVPVVPACGFEGVVGDLAAAVAAEHFGGPVDRLLIAHHRAGRPRPCGRPRRVQLPDGRRWAVPVDSLDDLLVSRHVPGASVVTVWTLPPVRRSDRAFVVVAEAHGPHTRSTVSCEGRDPERRTARFLVEAAYRLPMAPAGAHAPAEAFPPVAFLDAVAGTDFRWHFDHPEPGLERL